MPGPDPEGVTVYEDENGGFRVFAELWPSRGLGASNRQNRLRRMRAITRNLRRGWNCPWCKGPVPVFRRADAVYCSTSCRKKARYRRRLNKLAENVGGMRARADAPI
ncbi:MAG: hypothetical protein R3D84_15515 [Paracoccaceae bacterium]